MSKFDTAPNAAQDQEPIYNPDDLPILRAALSLTCAMMVEQKMKKEIGRAMAVLHEAAFFTVENTEQLKEVLLRVFQYPAFLDDPDKDDYFEFALHAALTQEGFEHFDAMTTVFATMFGGAPGNDHAAEELLKASKTDLFNQDMFNRLVSEIGWEAIVYALSWAYDERGIDPWRSNSSSLMTTCSMSTASACPRMKTTWRHWTAFRGFCRTARCSTSSA